MTATLYGICVLAYAALAAVLLLRTQPNPSRLKLVGACALTAVWAGVAVVRPAADQLAGEAGLLDLLRLCAWYAVALHFYRRFVPGRAGPGRALAATAGMVAALAGGAMLAGTGGGASVLTVRLALALCAVLLVENLLRRAPDEAGWNVNLAGIALGGLAVYDILLCTEAALFRQISPVLADGRPLAAVLVVPLLALAGLRAQKAPVPALSRSAAFHSASLVASGALLLTLAGGGEVIRAFGAHGGAVAELGLIAAGVVAVAVLLGSTAGRSRIRAVLVDPFFAERYDYRREWLRCIDTLAGAGSGGPLHARVIRTVAQVVDSPAGALFLREPGSLTFCWAGSWNMPALPVPVPAGHPLLAGFGAGDAIVRPECGALAAAPLDALAPLWLAVQLPRAGFVLLAPPRAPFALDDEVFALLRTVAREVATYLAEQRAQQALTQARQLGEFGTRFAFVAHDIKNVASQLALLLANAGQHMDNPEFQRDMLETVRASVLRIGGLLRRLQEPPEGAGRVAPRGRLEAIAADCRRLRGGPVIVEAAAAETEAAIAPAAFDAVVTHLLDNAVDAGAPVRIVLHREPGRVPGRVMVDIIDRGPGMTADFVREELFRPFRSSKREGSGIGAFQARELLREAGGDLIVLSRPREGTTMRMLLPLADDAPVCGGVTCAAV